MAKTSTSFKPGQSGNLKGRPKAEWTWSGLLREVSERIEEGSDKTEKELIAEALTREAKKGNVQAIKEYGDRMEGKAKQLIDVKGDVEYVFRVVQDNTLKDANTKNDRITDKALSKTS